MSLDIALSLTKAVIIQTLPMAVNENMACAKLNAVCVN